MSTFADAVVERIDAGWRVEVRRYDDPIVTELIRQLQAIYVERYGAPDIAQVDPEEFSPPRGYLLVGFLGDKPVASGGWRRIDASTAEIKRMYVSPRRSVEGCPG